jgi:acetyl-CoA carboxylase carboxyl transferase subunit alpha
MSTGSTPAPQPDASGSWSRVQLARHPKRPHSLDYFQKLIPGFQEIHGDRCYADDPAIVCGMGFLRDRPIVAIGQQKGRDTKQKLHRNFGMPKPEGYRKAMRVMEMAAKFSRPILTLLDTPGAYPGIDAEERGQAEAIAKNLREMSRLGTPIVAVVIGEGGSGGALALGVGNRVYMMENAIYSVISPESCAAIIWRDAAHAEKAACALRLTAPDLLRLDLIDGVIAEPGNGAHEDPDGAAASLAEAVSKAFDELGGTSQQQLVEERYQKFRRMGSFFEDISS